MTAYAFLILIPILYSLITGYKASKQIKSSRDFFLFHDGLVSEKLRNSITSSNLSLGAAIFAFLGLGFSFKLAAIISPITWLTGFGLLIWIFPKIKDLGNRTLHGYLAYRYKNSLIGFIASFASIIGFLGTYGIEILVSLKITTILLPSVPQLIIVVVISLIVAGYTALGGFKAATQLDSFRFWLSIIGLITVFIFSYHYAYQNSQSIEHIKEVIKSDGYGFSNLTTLFVFALMLLNIPWQLVDMSVWQKLVACKSSQDIKKGLKQSIWLIGIFWLLLILLGISLNFFPNFIAPSNGDFAAIFLTYLKNPVVFGLFSMGCFAAMMSTADSLLISSVQTLAQDIIYPHKNSEELFKASEDEKTHKTDKSILFFGRKWVIILGLFSPVFLYIINLIIPGILDLFFLVYSAQLTLLLPVCVAIFSNHPYRYKTIANISVSIGLISAFIMFVRMLVAPQPEIFLLTPIISVGISAIPWFLVFFIKAPKHQ